MVTKVNLYIAKDGISFDTEAEAIAYERDKCADWINQVFSRYADKYTPDALGFWAIDPEENCLCNNLYYGTFETAIVRVAEEMWPKRLNINIFWFPKLAK